jgi:dienelactone hydrolase
MQRLAGWALVLACAGCAGKEVKVEVQTVRLDYRDGGTVLEGYLAFPQAGGKRPGVLVVHEWMGPGEHVWDSARRLAAQGYVALAVDIYGRDLRPKNAEEAAKAAGRFRGGDRAELRSRMAIAHRELVATGRVDPSKVAAIGYCFGGTAALEFARSGADVRGVVSFHGGLSKGEGPSRPIRSRVLALHGADDPFVKPEEVRAFEREMQAAGADWRLVAYNGAVHSFTNPEAGDDPSRGVAYHAEADRRSWEEMLRFLRDVFAP